MRDNTICIIPNHENGDEEYGNEGNQQYASDSHKNNFKRKIISSSITTKKTKTSSIAHAPVINNRSNRYDDNEESEDSDDSSSGSESEHHFASVSRLSAVSRPVPVNEQQHTFIQAPHDFLPVTNSTPEAAANKKPRVQPRG